MTDASPRLAWPQRLASIGWLVLGGFIALCFVALAAVLLMNGVNAARALGPDAEWGAFEQSTCIPGKSACASIGTWSTADGALVLEDVALAGTVESDGSAVASLIPGRLPNLDGRTVVQTEADARLWVVLAWPLLTAVIGAVFIAPTVVVIRGIRRARRNPDAVGSTEE